MRKFSCLPLVLAVGCAALAAFGAAPVTDRPGQGLPPAVQPLLSGPLKGVQEVVFCSRSPYDDGHWYANIGYYCDDEHRKAYPGNGRPDVSKLCKLNLQTGQLTLLLDPRGGTVRDPQVHYDARKILFSLRKAGSDYFHLHEINADGTGLKQLTSGEWDDYEPIYLPDGGIVFVSTRCRRWVNCWMTQVGILYRCDADGSNIQVLSANTEHDNTPWVLPDGRLLYTRWEYVDRSQVEFHHLWTMNPDGTGVMIYYGNMHPNILMIDAKPVPGTDQVVASFSPGHGVNEHAGFATLVSQKKGPDDPGTARPLHKGKLTRDPYPLSANAVLAAQDNQIVFLDGTGKSLPLYAYPGGGQVHEPRPLIPRPRERILTSRVNTAAATGRMIIADIYSSRNMPGVKRGEIKKLLILESLPKPVNFSGGPDLVSWLGTFTLERVLGTVPVEEDGSACFEVPALRQIFFEALDEHDLSVKRMQSFTSVMPGESLSCGGCHEPRAKTPEPGMHARLQAMQRPPSRIEPFTGFPDVLDFHRDIQPILDRLCVSCHNYQKRDGKVILAGDLGPNWAHSFFSLFAFRQVADGRNGLGNQPPRTIGSSASPLLKMVDGSHYGAKATPREWRTLWLWIESGAAYAGSYAGLRNEQLQKIITSANVKVFTNPAIGRRCGKCHNQAGSNLDACMPLPLDFAARRKMQPRPARRVAAYERVVVENDPIAWFSTSILVNLTRPELSPLLLGPLDKAAGGFGSCGEVFRNTADPDYQALLKSIQLAKTEIEFEPRYAMPGFKPNTQYIRELKKYSVLPPGFDRARDTVDVFELDQKYWRSLWYHPLSLTRH